MTSNSDVFMIYITQTTTAKEQEQKITPDLQRLSLVFSAHHSPFSVPLGDQKLSDTL